ncbi:MarR family winged helix-turn-helix transcriptional regulator [Mycolicibacterium wolinskyi]|uniref:MarR family winged helix-turn-helix transcriptional regulator n=1 Tax=Mycolicibacterium wolinskyi TaxID=59750 RepID=UPI003917B57F
MSDQVDGILDQWAHEYPQIDASPMGIVGRIWRLSRHLEQQVHAVLAQFDCSLPDFDVLATLRRSGPPYSLTAGQLMESAMVTSGAITNRVDRLIERGLVTREPNAANRRIKQISLTAAGLDLIDKMIPVHVANERRMLAPLTDAEYDNLLAVLRKLLHAYET